MPEAQIKRCHLTPSPTLSFIGPGSWGGSLPCLDLPWLLLPWGRGGPSRGGGSKGEGPTRGGIGGGPRHQRSPTRWSTGAAIAVIVVHRPLPSQGPEAVNVGFGFLAAVQSSKVAVLTRLWQFLYVTSWISRSWSLSWLSESLSSLRRASGSFSMAVMSVPSPGVSTWAVKAPLGSFRPMLDQIGGVEGVGSIFLGAGASRWVGLHRPSNRNNVLLYFVNGLYPILII